MKGHSERIKNKNLKLFNGKPLYHTIVNTLLASKHIEFIVINSDSALIEQDAKKNFGDNIVFIKRPRYIQGDFVSMNKIIAHDLSVLEGEHFLQTHSTNPLLKAETIDKAIDKYYSKLNNCDSLFSITKLQTRLYDKSLHPVNHNPAELIRTQDLEPLYEENSNLYIFSKSSFINAKNKRIGIKPTYFEIKKLEAIDIDYEEDFIIAEAIMKKIKDYNHET